MKRRSENVPLEEHIANIRNEMAQERLMAPILREDAQRFRLLASKCTARYQQRKKVDLNHLAEQKEKQADELESGERETKFECSLQPYKKAYAMSLKRKKVLNDDGARSSSNLSLQQKIISEFISDNRGSDPRMALSHADTCQKCNSSMLLVPIKSLLACPRCGESSSYLDATSAALPYGDEIDFTSYSYKRINHFNEWMAQIQGKESFQVPEDVLEKVMQELYRRRVALADINPAKVREILKYLKLRRCYEHVVQITSRITGVPPIRMSSEMEERCRLMFLAVQPAFDKHKTSERKNFLSYSYILYKFLELLGYSQILGAFSLLKGKDKLMKQDQIFCKIANELNWEFIPSC